ncbi:hypothetical protein SLNSH_10285 [Alsobacter soli]|uniref:Chemotaxis protein CheZ n=1 Tax=Alsobacter soli TaxID=2109933 RepID=A0A2T1HU68_9HYPH|nr:hypothetical protein [Alsobacter soli]PSC05192.1 hypothetical protein SLNSH_10285 [Alsobacter soli]
MADTPQTPLSSDDYEAIEAAVMETSRGRWFLAEYARRNRHAETERLLQSLNRIERAVSSRDAQAPDAAAVLGVQRDLADIADKIARTRQDIAQSVAEAVGSGKAPPPEKAFDELVAMAEQADTDAFEAAEQIQEIAWSLRESAENPEVAGVLDDLDRHALDVYRATNRHTVATTRVRSILTVLRGIEARIQAMLGADQRASRPPAPALPPASTAARADIAFAEQHPLGARIAQRPSPPPVLEKPKAPPAQQPLAPASPAEGSRAAAFAAIDALSQEQKLALFA